MPPTVRHEPPPAKPILEAIAPHEAMKRRGLRPFKYLRLMKIDGRRHLFIEGHPRVLVLRQSEGGRTR